MTTLDFSPLFRSTVGFDRMTRMLESALRADEAASGYPPYNIEKTDENAYRITMAVAGFAEQDIEIEVKEQMLVVSGKTEDAGNDRRYLYRGIAGRAFRRTFQLADYVKVAGAQLVNGLLHVDLVREIPEEMRPRRIEIQAASSAPRIEATDARKAA
jgi:molecular chaperone IbpA